MIKCIAHVCFQVADLEKSVAFYRDQMGMQHAFDFQNEQGERTGAYLKVGPRCFLELFQARGTPVQPSGSPYRHFCLEVEDFEKTLAELRERGVNITGAKRGMDQSWQAWLTDPDGNRIELHAYTPESWQAPHLEKVAPVG